MPNWNTVLKELDDRRSIDSFRRDYLLQIHNHTNRNVICYYSAFLQKTGLATTGINDGDKNALMTVIHGMNKSLGLDLILHTPGGDIAATESIVYYLRAIFGNNIRVIIPQIAMSAGTMISCAASEIIMGHQSNIGPFDPQFGGMPAHGVVEEFQKAKDEVTANPSTLGIWQPIIAKYHPTFIGDCEKAIKWAGELVHEWLKTGMFKDDPEAEQKSKIIVDKLNNHVDTFTHSRHIHIKEALAIGLKVTALEDDNVLQDLVLTSHHIYMQTLGESPAVKIIETQSGQCMVYNNAEPRAVV